MIGLVIPGVPLITCGPITQNMAIVDVYDPKNISNISLFLQELIPEGYGAALYFSIPPFSDAQFIGCIANQRPSDVFYTGWSLNSDVNCHQQIKVCIKLEPLSQIKDAFENKIKNDTNIEFAKKIAKNLFNFLDSYNGNKDPNSNLLIVPISTLQNWYDKFEMKYKVDPNFLMKTDN